MKDISLFILDLVQNSIQAAANEIKLMVEKNSVTNELIIEISDNGKGMQVEEMQQAINPFFTSRKTRKVGLGLALAKKAVENTGGSLFLSSNKENMGTTLKLIFNINHIDMPPLGDIANTLVLLMQTNKSINFLYHITNKELEFKISSIEVYEQFEKDEVSGITFRKDLENLIQNNTQRIIA